MSGFEEKAAEDGGAGGALEFSNKLNYELGEFSDVNNGGWAVSGVGRRVWI